MVTLALSLLKFSIGAFPLLYVSSNNLTHIYGKVSFSLACLVVIKTLTEFGAVLRYISTTTSAPLGKVELRSDLLTSSLVSILLIVTLTPLLVPVVGLQVTLMMSIAPIFFAFIAEHRAVLERIGYINTILASELFMTLIGVIAFIITIIAGNYDQAIFLFLVFTTLGPAVILYLLFGRPNTIL